MLIQCEQLIAGRPAVEVRELMRSMRRACHSEAGLAAVLAVTIPEASRLVADLRAEGLIEVAVGERGPYVVGRDEDHLWPELLTPTIRGNALAKARIGKPMSRSDARKLCEGVVARAEGVNADGDWLHWVDSVGLYGSFARPGNGPVGDVDLAVRLERRYEGDDHVRRNEAMVEVGDARPQSFVDWAFYAQRKLLRYLRGRSPRVDLVQDIPGGGLPPGISPVPLYQYSPDRLPALAAAVDPRPRDAWA